MNHLTHCRMYKKYRSTADILAVVSEKIDRTYIRSVAARTVAFCISKPSEGVSHAGFLHKPKYYGISGWVSDLIFSFFRRRIRVFLDGKSARILVFLKAPILVLRFSSYTVLTFLMMLSHDTVLYSKCDQASDLWQQLELASELNLMYEILWIETKSDIYEWYLS